MTNGKGATKIQLMDLYRGLVASTKKTIFDTSSLAHMGSGKSKKKPEVEKIFTSMIVKHLLLEKSTKNAQGYNVSYCTFGVDAGRVRSGQRDFTMEITIQSEQGAQGAQGATKSPAKKSAAAKKTTPKKKEGKAAKSGGSRGKDIEDDLGFDDEEVIDLVDSDVDDDDSGDLESSSSHQSGRRTAKRGRGILSKKECDGFTEALMQGATVLAEAETAMMHMINAEAEPIKKWNIIRQDQIKLLAVNPPTNMEEFLEVSTLGDVKNKKNGKDHLKTIVGFLKEIGRLVCSERTLWREHYGEFIILVVCCLLLSPLLSPLSSPLSSPLFSSSFVSFSCLLTFLLSPHLYLLYLLSSPSSSLLTFHLSLPYFPSPP